MGLVFFFFSLSFSLLLGAGEAAHKSCYAQFPGDQHHLNASGLHLMLHHVHGPCSPFSVPPLPFSDLLRHDELRVRSLNSRLTGKKPIKSPLDPIQAESINLPMNPGQSVSVGNYVAKIGLGTPSRAYIVVVDTGSSLSWIQCQPCRVSCHPQQGPIFDPASSNTYRASTCKSDECMGLQSATLNPNGCTSSNTCLYQASYGDGSMSVGYLSRDTLTLNSGQSVPGFIYGCGQDNEGLFGASAGLVGLARNKLSMLAQLAPKYGYAFSYCLPTSASTGFLSIGASAVPGAKYTNMYSSVDASLYSLKLTSIEVGGRALAVSGGAYGGPTIIDSGTVISRIQPAVYDALSRAVARAMTGVARAPGYSILDTCFKGSAARVGARAPAVKMVFEGGAELDLKPQNLLIDIDSGTTCLAFAKASGVAIVGNRQQQTFRVVYDVAKSKIGFAPGGCS
ncbi:Protein ASPARTIC PROTEASE IN GUARD CELL 1 [Acorus calamus]|uniref:Protein ASPARTIC PROTEASE IN GUARD CELL 1 n=1 Tax=Acorus calamus TaxID=4465 RepID=A0AAV9D7F7_ACOCL|nr:Protein ASPARTIC PROTEASE IN GUARD CELL 1 [Acorus calamus]